MKKLVLVVLTTLLILSCTENETSKTVNVPAEEPSLPELDTATYGNIIGVWENAEAKEKGFQRYIVITDKNVFLEYWTEEGNQWKDFEHVEVPNLSKTGNNSYAFKFLWDSDWQAEWDSLAEDELELYKSVEDLRSLSMLFYIIDENGNLGDGAYLTFMNAPDKVKVHLKSTKFAY